MASLQISTPFKSFINPSSTPQKPLKTPTFLYKSNPPQSNAIASSSKSLSHAEGSGLGLGFSPFASAPQMPAMRGAEGDVMGMLLKERILFVGDIDDLVADVIISQMMLLDAQDHTKDIRLFINSRGGSHSATTAIYDVIQLVRADVSTIGIGITASTSLIILGGGTKGKRFAMPNTRIMLQQPRGGTGGTAKDVEIQARELLKNKEAVIKIVSVFTGRSYGQVKKDLDSDLYMSPAEAVEYGIIDGMIDRDAIIQLMPGARERSLN